MRENCSAERKNNFLLNENRRKKEFFGKNKLHYVLHGRKKENRNKKFIKAQ